MAGGGISSELDLKWEESLSGIIARTKRNLDALSRSRQELDRFTGRQSSSPANFCNNFPGPKFLRSHTKPERLLETAYPHRSAKTQQEEWHTHGFVSESTLEENAWGSGTSLTENSQSPEGLESGVGSGTRGHLPAGAVDRLREDLDVKTDELESIQKSIKAQLTKLHREQARIDLQVRDLSNSDEEERKVNRAWIVRQREVGDRLDRLETSLQETKKRVEETSANTKSLSNGDLPYSFFKSVEEKLLAALSQRLRNDLCREVEQSMNSKLQQETESLMQLFRSMEHKLNTNLGRQKQELLANFQSKFDALGEEAGQTHGHVAALHKTTERLESRLSVLAEKVQVMEEMVRAEVDQRKQVERKIAANDARAAMELERTREQTSTLHNEVKENVDRVRRGLESGMEKLCARLAESEEELARCRQELTSVTTAQSLLKDSQNEQNNRTKGHLQNVWKSYESEFDRLKTELKALRSNMHTVERVQEEMGSEMSRRLQSAVERFESELRHGQQNARVLCETPSEIQELKTGVDGPSSDEISAKLTVGEACTIVSGEVVSAQNSTNNFKAKALIDKQISNSNERLLGETGVEVSVPAHDGLLATPETYLAKELATPDSLAVGETATPGSIAVRKLVTPECLVARALATPESSERSSLEPTRPEAESQDSEDIARVETQEADLAYAQRLEELTALQGEIVAKSSALEQEKSQLEKERETLHTEQQSAARVLEAKQKEVEAREQALSGRLHAREQALERKTEQVRDLERTVNAQVSEIDARKEALMKKAEELRRREEQLDREKTELQAKERKLSEELRQRREELNLQKAELEIKVQQESRRLQELQRETQREMERENEQLRELERENDQHSVRGRYENETELEKPLETERSKIELEAYQSQLNELKSEHERCLQLLEQMRIREESLRESESRLQKESASLGSRATAQSESNRKLVSQTQAIPILRARIQSLEKQINDGASGQKLEDQVPFSGTSFDNSGEYIKELQLSLETERGLVRKLAQEKESIQLLYEEVVTRIHVMKEEAEQQSKQRIDLESKADELKTSRDIVESKLPELTSELERLSRLNAELENDKVQAEQASKQATEKLNSLLEQQRREREEGASKSHHTESEQTAEHEQTVSEFNAGEEELARIKAAFDEAVKQTEALKAQAQASLLAQQEELHELKTQRETMKREQEESEANLALVKESLSVSASEQERLRGELEAVREQLLAGQRQNEEAQSECESLKERERAAQTVVETLKQQIQSMTATKEKNEKAIEGQQKMIDELHDQIESDKETVSNLQRRLATMQRQLSAIPILAGARKLQHRDFSIDLLDKEDLQNTSPHAEKHEHDQNLTKTEETVATSPLPLENHQQEAERPSGQNSESTCSTSKQNLAAMRSSIALLTKLKLEAEDAKNQALFRLQTNEELYNKLQSNLEEQRRKAERLQQEKETFEREIQRATEAQRATETERRKYEALFLTLTKEKATCETDKATRESQNGKEVFIEKVKGLEQLNKQVMAIPLLREQLKEQKARTAEKVATLLQNQREEDSQSAKLLNESQQRCVDVERALEKALQTQRLFEEERNRLARDLELGTSTFNHQLQSKEEETKSLRKDLETEMELIRQKLESAEEEKEEALRVSRSRREELVAKLTQKDEQILELSRQDAEHRQALGRLTVQISALSEDLANVNVRATDKLKALHQELASLCGRLEEAKLAGVFANTRKHLPELHRLQQENAAIPLLLAQAERYKALVASVQEQAENGVDETARGMTQTDTVLRDDDTKLTSDPGTADVAEEHVNVNVDSSPGAEDAAVRPPKVAGPSDQASVVAAGEEDCVSLRRMETIKLTLLELAGDHYKRSQDAVELAEEKSKLLGKIESLELENKSITSAFETTKADLQRSLAEHQTIIQQMQTEASDAVAAYKTRGKQVAGLRKAVDALPILLAQLQSMQSAREASSSKQSEKESLILSLNQKLRDCQRQMREQEALVKSLEEELQQAKSRQDTLEQELGVKDFSHTKQCEEISDRVKKMQQERLQAVQECKRLREQCQAVPILLHKLSQDSSSSVAQKAEFMPVRISESPTNNIEEELERSKSEIEDLQTSLEGVERERHRLEEEKQAMERHIDAFERRLHDTASKTSELESSDGSDASTLPSLKLELETLREKLAASDRRSSEIRYQLQTARKQCEAMPLLALQAKRQTK